MQQNTTDILYRLAHAGHHHPEQTAATLSNDMTVVGVVLAVTVLLVLALVAFDKLRNKSK